MVPRTVACYEQETNRNLRLLEAVDLLGLLTVGMAEVHVEGCLNENTDREADSIIVTTCKWLKEKAIGAIQFLFSSTSTDQFDEVRQDPAGPDTDRIKTLSKIQNDLACRCTELNTAYSQLPEVKLVQTKSGFDSTDVQRRLSEAIRLANHYAVKGSNMHDNCGCFNFHISELMKLQTEVTTGVVRSIVEVPLESKLYQLERTLGLLCQSLDRQLKLKLMGEELDRKGEALQHELGKLCIELVLTQVELGQLDSEESKVNDKLAIQKLIQSQKALGWEKLKLKSECCSANIITFDRERVNGDEHLNKPASVEDLADLFWHEQKTEWLAQSFDIADHGQFLKKFCWTKRMTGQDILDLVHSVTALNYISQKPHAYVRFPPPVDAQTLFIHALGGSGNQQIHDDKLKEVRERLQEYISSHKLTMVKSTETDDILHAIADDYPSTNYDNAFLWNVSCVGSEKVKPFIEWLTEVYKEWYSNWDGFKSHDMYTIKCRVLDLLLWQSGDSSKVLECSFDNIALILYLTRSEIDAKNHILQLRVKNQESNGVSWLQHPLMFLQLKGLADVVAFNHAMDKVHMTIPEGKDYHQALKHAETIQTLWNSSDIRNWDELYYAADGLSSYLEQNNIDPFPFLKDGTSFLDMIKKYNVLPNGSEDVDNQSSGSETENSERENITESMTDGDCSIYGCCNHHRCNIV